MKQVNLAGKSKGFLLMLMLWQILKLVLIIGGIICIGVALVTGFIAIAGVPLLLIGLGALLVFPPISAERKRAIAITWW